MLLTILLLIVVAIAAILGYAAMRPATFRVQRQTSIKAPPESIFPFINDFRNWPRWSPYEKLDPAMKRTVSDAAAGQGATYAWEGNSKAGAGRMEIAESVPPQRIAIKLAFTRPFKANHTAEFTLQPEGDATRVTWAMHGPNLFVAKVMGLFIDMDRMIGRDFEAGLATLKTEAEKQATGSGA